MPRKKDWAEEQTDDLLDTLENRIKREYSKAFKEVRDKYLEFSAQFKKDDADMKAKLDAGEITESQYKAWRSDEMLIGKRWEAMKNTLAEDLTLVDEKVASMTYGYTPEAYAMNHNYGVFETEKGSRIDTSYTLYSRETVERLLRDNPKLLPKRKLDIPKDKIWNKRHINSAITQGVLQGKSLPQIANNLRQVTDMDRRAAIRNARTMMTGAQNAGRLDAYKRAESLGIKVMKEWMATLDHHTRDSHAKLDGEKVPLDEKFSNGLMFPGDPDGKNPAEIYNCRCTMVADTEEYPDTDMKRYDNIAGKTIDKITYAEWAGWKKVEEKTHVIQLSYDERIRNIISDPNMSQHEKIMEAGKVFADEMNSSFVDGMKEADKEIKKMNKELREAEREYWRCRSISDEEMNKAQAIYNEINRKTWEARQEFKRNYGQEACTEKLTEMLRKIRPIGGVDAKELKAHLSNSRSPIRGSIEYAYSHYPTDWVRASMKRGNLKPKKTDRGYYSDWDGVIAISGDWDDTQRETAFHELGHRFEKAIPQIMGEEKEFYEKRTVGEPLEWLGGSYSRSEKTRKDDFLDWYMGKDYGGDGYELVSMGFQYAYVTPDRLSRDPEMQAWIYGILTTVNAGG